MRFFEVVISGAALIAAALAVELNDVPASVQAGQTYTITYSPKDNTPTTLILRKGLSTDLGTIGPITTSATGGSFQWTVPSDLVNGNDYALEIQQAGAEPNYSGQFPLSGGLTASASKAASASATGYPTASAMSSASAVVSSAMASSTVVASVSMTKASTMTAIASASGSLVPSAGANSTVTSATLSGGATATASGGPAESTGGASTLGSSPLALLFGAVAAMAYLN